MQNTSNFGLQKPEPLIDNVNIDVINGNMDTVDVALGNTAKFEKAGGTATAITLTGITLEDGRSKNFIVKADNNSVATTINGKPLYKPGTTITPKLKIGTAVTAWYDLAGDCFFIKASAGGGGTVTASDVLAPKTFVNEDGDEITGIVVNHGSIGTQNLISEGAEYTIPAGYHNGLGKVKAAITGLIASVIKAGTTVGGILGTFTSDATATASQILSGVTAYVNGSKVTGTIVSKAAATYTPGTTDQTIAAGQYLSGAQTIKGDANLLTSNILKGKTIFGVTGKASVVDTADANAVAADISSGKTGYVNGNKVTGTLVSTKYATGTVLANSTPSNATLQDGTVINAYQAAVSGLSFLPKNIVAFAMYGTEEYGVSYNQHGPAVSSKVFNSYRAPASGPGAAYKLHSTVNPFIVTETGFVLPVLQGGITYTWYAYE
ncbi:MAG: hypothetical protein K0R92_336 [Lachnospiraceae bacterium]|nr:hypothetical protein [Lachnospiraceae bacterium]